MGEGGGGERVSVSGEAGDQHFSPIALEVNTKMDTKTKMKMKMKARAQGG